MFGHVLERVAVFCGVACCFDCRPQRGRPLSGHGGPPDPAACKEPEDDCKMGEIDEAIATSEETHDENGKKEGASAITE